MIIELSFHITEYYNVSICKCKDVIHLGIMSCCPFCCYGVKFSCDELSYRV